MSDACVELAWQSVLVAGVVAGLAAGMVVALVVAMVEGVHTPARDRYGRDV